jgi:hypothetical protein
MCVGHKVQRVYYRCNSGHYFASPYCPLDGWHRAFTLRMFEVVNKIQKSGERVSIELLAHAGFEEEALKRVIIIDFGSEAAVFEALIPESYVINGSLIPLGKVGLEYL